MKDNLQVFLYNRDLATPTLDQTLTDRVENLRFDTKLNGGFTRAAFSIKATLAESWEWLTTRKFYRLVIKDNRRTVFEGRLQDMVITPQGLEITAYGYWSSLRDEEETTAYNANADVVIKAALTAHAPQINADQSHIDATDVAITSAADATYLDIKIQDLINKLLDFGDTADNKWYFAIWEDRIPYMFAKDVSSVDWMVRLRDLADFKLQHSTSDLWNRVYAIYLVAGVVTRTGLVNDTDSQEKYGDGVNDLIRLYGVPNLGEVAVAAANAARDVWLENHKEVFPSFETLVLGDKVYDATGAAYPSSWVRAGDVIRITDLVPTTVNLDTIVADGLRTFYILETQYNADRLENSLKVDVASKGLDALLVREL